MRTWLGVAAVLALAWACGGKAIVDSKGAGGAGGSSTMAGGLSDAVGTPASSATGPCNATCDVGLSCCNGQCVNLQNDIHNCSACNVACTGTQNFCDNGKCAAAPCKLTESCPAKDMTCCGSACCKAGQLCCNVQMGGPSGGPICADPVNGTCPVGCPACL